MSLFNVLPFILFYCSAPLVFLLFDSIKRGLQRQMRTRSTQRTKNTELRLRDKIKMWKKFAFKRSNYKIICIVLYVMIPLINAILGIFVYNLATAIILSFALYFVYIFIIRMITQKHYEEELKLLKNLLDFKKSQMGLIDNDSTEYSYQKEYEILEWNEDNLLPTKIKFFVPINFNNDNRINFVGALSEKFGAGGLWTVSDEDGWDDKNQTVIIQKDDFFGEKKQRFLKNFLQFKQQEMGLVYNKTTLYTYETELKVLEWDEEERPTRIRLFLPVGYNPMRQDDFLDKMSTAFGRGRPWEVDNDDKEFPGWNTDILIATLALQKPLPNIAMWHEKWLLNDSVQWSFFPLGIGSKGGIPFTDPETGEEVRLVGYSVDKDQKDWASKNGIYAGGDLEEAPHVLGAGVTGGGKSVVQRNIILSCLMRPKDWILCIVDLKRVEGAMWRKYGVPVATTYQDAAALLSFAQATMMERFLELEKRGLNNWGQLPPDKRGPAILVVIDEVAELLAPITGKSDVDKENAEYQAQCQYAIESIARLGRAARVHQTTFGQRPSSDVVSMQIRQNAPVRIACGSLPQTISQMVFEFNFGSTVPASPRGRIGIRVHSAPPMKAQGFYAPEEWFDEYLERNNLPTDIYEGSLMREKYEQNKAEMDAKDAFEDEMSDAEFEELARALGE